VTPPLGEGRDGLRARQERELAMRLSVVAMEHALAREAVHVGRAMSEAGVPFDPMTFVALRVLEAVVAERLDPVEMLDWMASDGSLERTVELARAGLADA
jgi:hypothetical protein